MTHQSQKVNLGQAIQTLQGIETSLNQRLFERTEAIRLGLVALLAKQHAVLLGPPGTAKSLLTRSIVEAFVDPQTGEQLANFEWLATSFMTPEELFGPVDLNAYKAQGVYKRIIDGKLPSAKLVFLDECFKAQGASLNMLLTALNERLFHNPSPSSIPLMSFFGASNELPQGDDTAALWDRLLLRFNVGYLTTEWQAMMLLDETTLPAIPVMDEPDLVALQKATSTIVQVAPDLIHHIGTLKAYLAGEGITVSDRRWRASLGVLRAHALLEGRKAVTEDDLDIYRHILWSMPEQIPVVARGVAKAGNPLKVELMDTIDAAMTVYSQAIQQEATMTDDIEITKYMINALAKLRSAKKRVRELAPQVRSRQTDHAVAKFEQAFESIAAKAVGDD